MISSTTNKQVKFVHSLAKKTKVRRETGLFIVEGLRICGEISKERIDTLYLAESFSRLPESEPLTREVRRVEIVSDEVFQYMADTKSPQGVLALVKQHNCTLDDIWQAKGQKPVLLMILDTLQDPGNLGTIIRAGEGAGVTAVIMNETTADIYNPKVIRSTMGSVFRVPFVSVDDLPAALRWLKAKGVCLYAAHLDGKNNYDQEDYTNHIGFLIGNEAAGLSRSVSELADRYIKIPMLGSVESLNAAVAASVLMYEAARQRRQP
ncbi:MAG: TrmH family RNA methyltransferase [Lachnospiraceae bacterium]